MTSFSLWNFWIPCIFMGAGIAIDVAVSTLSKFHDRDLSFRTWTAPVTATHIAFPAAGYYLFWGTAGAFPWLHPVLGVIGFILVALFVYEVLATAIGTEPVFSVSDLACRLFRIRPENGRRFVTVLAVSWDALLSGPAMAAQATAANWTTTEVVLSFVIAGAVVALIAETSLKITFRLRTRHFHNANSLARFTYHGTFLELSVIGGFGILSLWNGFTGAGNLYLSIILAGFLLSLFFLNFSKCIMAHMMYEAKAIIE